MVLAVVAVVGTVVAVVTMVTVVASAVADVPGDLTRVATCEVSEQVRDVRRAETGREVVAGPASNPNSEGAGPEGTEVERVRAGRDVVEVAGVGAPVSSRGRRAPG